MSCFTSSNENSRDTMVSPLEGIKVLDVSRWGPSSYCTMVLGDLGAHIVKVESLPQQKIITETGGSPSSRREAAYNSLNRNKKSIVLNLKVEEARQVFYRLAQRSDVIVEDFRPGVVKRLGIDYETIRSIAPKIIYCSISGYGQDGPYRDLPGHDINYLALAGVLGTTTETDKPPVIPLNVIGNYAAGSLNAVIGILAAIRVKETDGKGQYVDIAMVDGVISLLTTLTIDYFSKDVVPKWARILAGLPGYYGVYGTQDGKYISLGCVESWAWENLCHALKREDFIPYPYAEGKKGEEISSSLREIFLSKPRDEWFNFLRQRGVNVAPVYELDEVFADPQVIHRKMVVDIDCSPIGKVKQVGVALKLSDTPGQIKRTAPILGEHTEEVLQELGYSTESIEKLRKLKAIYSYDQ